MLSQRFSQLVEVVARDGGRGRARERRRRDGMANPVAAAKVDAKSGK
jgi:hypothetical protein